MKIKAAVVNTKGGPFVFEEIDLAEPKDDELIVKVVASGICHTDEFGRQGGMNQKFPAVFGHEGAGIIEKVGAEVKNFQVGDHVVFSYGYCGNCAACRSGKPFYCDHYNEINFGGTAADGKSRLSKNGEDIAMFFAQSSFATHSVINSRSAIKIDKDVNLEIAAPLGCGIQTGAGTITNIIKPSINSTIAVLGMGAVGLSAIMAANMEHCKEIIAIGGNSKSLELAKELGATHTINRKEVDDIVKSIHEIVPGGVDYCIDTSGFGPMIEKAIKASSFNGSIFVLGSSGIIDSFNIGEDILMNMRTLRGTCEGECIAQVYIPEIIRMYKEGRFPIDKIITVYDFEDIEQAFKDSHDGKVIKPVIRISK
ncbi:NAD(P)-dependent alcohol dehydrogenase [Clostridium senegalense]|uniref:NAD(P)-dependent alcohol dehydrogenase n=1 Tax=Clostridium senegalense TaxID=1465809 RepID=UPI000287C846|nr:NAD(P)-dependent alcohol dehydrogenase [Clostridium senegalense]